MPTYEYECKKCGNFEEFQSITAKPLAKCSRCGGRVRRLIGAGGGVIFKGSGFYETDYKRKSGGGQEGSKKDLAAGKSESPAKDSGKNSVDSVKDKKS